MNNSLSSICALSLLATLAGVGEGHAAGSDSIDKTASPWAIGDRDFMTVQDGRFIDREGRHVILHGVNVIRKSKPYISWHGPEEYANMRRWGFNCIRLGTLWAAVEPECGKYDEAYLRELDQRIAWARENGLYVLLDMHQDLWGEKPGGDGAPEWATLDGGKPHSATGSVWSDAYFTSPMIQAAFDSFWANKPGPDGVGIQDRFAMVWRHLAERYADEPAIVGYDILNEPFAGTAMLAAPLRLLPQLTKILAEDSPDGAAPGLLELIEMAGDMDGRLKLIEKVSDIEVYRKLVDAVGPVFQAFEKDALGPMYRRVAQAIREVDQKHIIFIEPSPTSNAGVRSQLEPLPGPGGAPAPLQALAPHTYDLVLDTPAAAQASDVRIRLIFERYVDLARANNLPMLIGEWGAFYGNPDALPVARMFVRLFEETLAGNTYWDFHKNLEKASYFETLQRPFPVAVSGTLLRYHTDPETRALECVWREDPAVTAPSRVYVPALWYPDGFEVQVTPTDPPHKFRALDGGDASGYLVLPATGQDIERRLTVRPKS